VGADGRNLSTERNSDGFACMDVLAKCPFSSNTQEGLGSRVVVTADIKQRLQVYLMMKGHQFCAIIHLITTDFVNYITSLAIQFHQD